MCESSVQSHSTPHGIAHIGSVASGSGNEVSSGPEIDADVARATMSGEVDSNHRTRERTGRLETIEDGIPRAARLGEAMQQDQRWCRGSFTRKDLGIQRPWMSLP